MTTTDNNQQLPQLRAEDFYEIRHGEQSMRFPCDADTTRRLEWVIAGGQRLSLLRRLLRRITKTPKAHHSSEPPK